MPTYAIDFETYYDKDYRVSNMSPERYCADKRFDPYLMAIVGDGCQDFVGTPFEFNWNLVGDHPHFVAHNARFDMAVFLEAQKRNLIPKGVSPSWDCTADLTAYLKCGRSLADASQHLLRTPMDKGMRDRMKGKTWAKAVALGWAEDLKDYARVDAGACRDVWNLHSEKWPEKERRVSRLNRDAGHRGIRVDLAMIDTSLQHLKTVKWEAEKGIPWDWSDNNTPLSQLRLAAECRRVGIEVPASTAEDSEDFAIWEAKYGAQYPWAGYLRRWRKANILEKKLLHLKNNSIDGVYNFSIKYAGAHTLRFSGGGGFNMQNMYREALEGIHLRRHFLPRPGYRFLIPDFCQIEARILQWFAGNKRMLDRMTEGESIYEAYSRETGRWTREETLKKADPDLYRLVKAQVLGCGYGMGAERYQGFAKDQYGIDMTPEVAQSEVRQFRSSNPGVVNLWNTFQRDLEWCAHNREPYEVNVPSGRTMEYFNIERRSDGVKAQVTRDKPPVFLFGGKVTENLVQATARDVLVEAWLRLHDAGHEVLFTTHDDLCIEVPIGTNPDPIVSMLRETPDWLTGCPLDVEYKLVDRYE